MFVYIHPIPSRGQLDPRTGWGPWWSTWARSSAVGGSLTSTACSEGGQRCLYPWATLGQLGCSQRGNTTALHAGRPVDGAVQVLHRCGWWPWPLRIRYLVEAGLQHGTLSFRLTQILSGYGGFGKYLHSVARKELSPAWHHYDCSADSIQYTLAVCPTWELQRRFFTAVIGGELPLRAKHEFQEISVWIGYFMKSCSRLFT